MSFSARGMSFGGAAGTWRVRLGGTDSGTDGTVLATLSVTASSLATVATSATFSSPGGTQILKLTGTSSVEGLDTVLESVICTFSAG